MTIPEPTPELIRDGKAHQNVLVFLTGEADEMQRELGKVEVPEEAFDLIKTFGYDVA